jgi:hypothetical protein
MSRQPPFTAKNIIKWLLDPHTHNGIENIDRFLVSPTCEDEKLLRKVISNISIQKLIELATQIDDLQHAVRCLRFLTTSLHLTEITNQMAKSSFFWNRLEILLQFSNDEHLFFLWDQIFILVSTICRIVKKKYSKTFLKSDVLHLLLEKEERFGKFSGHLKFIVNGLIFNYGVQNRAMMKFFQKQGLMDKSYLLDPLTAALLNIPLRESKPCAAAGLSWKKGMGLKAKNCATCRKKETKNKKLLGCAACRSIFYCDAECQKKDWKRHKKTCKKLKN